MKRLVKEQDMFGHPVSLNFNKKGTTANTLLGGCCSILVKLFLLGFVIFRLHVMINRDDNEYQVTDTPVDFEELGEIEMGDVEEGLLPFLFVQNYKT